jgi:putative hemolysin
MHFRIILLIALIGISAFFSLAEAALLSLSRLRIRNLIDKKRRGSIELEKLKDDPDRLLITLLVGNNVVNVSASAIATALSIEIFKDNALGISIGIMTFLLLVFGEILPKSLGIQHNVTFSLMVAKPIWILSVIFYPIIRVFDYMIDIFMNLLSIKKTYKPIVT